MSVGVVGFFGILSGMFFILAKNPKRSKSIPIRNHMVSKTKFIAFSVLSAFVFIIVIAIISGLYEAFSIFNTINTSPSTI